MSKRKRKKTCGNGYILVWWFFCVLLEYADAPEYELRVNRALYIQTETAFLNRLVPLNKHGRRERWKRLLPLVPFPHVNKLCVARPCINSCSDWMLLRANAVWVGTTKQNGGHLIQALPKRGVVSAKSLLGSVVHCSLARYLTVICTILQWLYYFVIFFSYCFYCDWLLLLIVSLRVNDFLKCVHALGLHIIRA